MARLHSTRSIHAAGALACTVGAIVAVAASPAGAQVPTTAVPAAPAAPSPTLAVTGNAQVKPAPRDKSSNASIKKAVSVARRKAIPLAIGNGQGHAAVLAKASGFPLGRLVSITQTNASTPLYIGPYFGEDGTFAPGRYCGTVRTAVYARTASGARKVVRTRSRHTCRVPAYVSVSLEMVFSTDPAAKPIPGAIPFPGPVGTVGTVQPAVSILH
jgi:hypothetical protein